MDKTAKIQNRRIKNVIAEAPEMAKGQTVTSICKGVKVMRLSVVMSLLVFAPLLLSVGAIADDNPTENGPVYFGLPFSPTLCDSRSKYSVDLCLTDTIAGHTKVVLISRTKICSANISSRFRCKVPGGGSFHATLLERDSKCQGEPVVAVLQSSAASIRLVSPSDDHSPISKELETEARRCLKSAEEDHIWPMSDSQPRILRVGTITLLIFDFEFEPEFSGPIIVIAKNEVLRLDGWCTNNHVLFSVKDKLHLAYRAPCCGCGSHFLYVYDLSGPIPKQVYENGVLSDRQPFSSQDSAGI